MGVGFDTWKTKLSSTKFVVQNNTTRRIGIFTVRISPGQQYDLLNIPQVSEADIRHSLLKGALLSKLRTGELRVIESTIDLTQFDPAQKAFLESVGVTYGLNSPTTPTTSVATVSLLAALPSTTILAWVEQLRCFFEYDSQSTLAPDGITIIGSNAGGNWIRIVASTSYEYLAQAAWVIDPTNGSDLNAGDAAAPLASFDELNRRLSVGPIRQNVTVTIPAGASIPEGASLYIDRGIYLFSILGTPTTVITGSVNTYTDRTHAGIAPEAGLLTDLGIADWTPYVGMRIRITSGASTGAISFIATANPNGAGVNVARVVRFGAVPTVGGLVTAVSPAPGSAYVIESLPILGGLSFKDRNQRAVTAALPNRAFFLSSFAISSNTASTLSIETNSTSVWNVDGCWLDCQCSFSGPQNFSLRVISRSRIGGPNLANFNIRGAAVWRHVLVKTTGFMVSIDVSSWQIDTALFQSSSQGVANVLAGSLFSSLYLRDSQFFDCGTAINFQNSGTINCIAGLSGTGNTIGLTIGDPDNEAQVLQVFTWAQTTDLPNLLGVTTPIRVRATGGDINLTWAQVPFSSNRQNGVGTLQNGTVVVPARNANTLGVKLSKATPAGNPQGQLSAPTASRTVSQFTVNSIDITGVLVATDQSTFDWEVPGFARPITICQANQIQSPV